MNEPVTLCRGAKDDEMKMTLICEHCGKKTSFPKLSKNGKKAKCGHCGKWQTFTGVMILGKSLFEKINLCRGAKDDDLSFAMRCFYYGYEAYHSG